MCDALYGLPDEERKGLYETMNEQAVKLKF